MLLTLVFIANAALIMIAYALIVRHIDKKLGGVTVTPLWKYATMRLSAVLTHPHEFASELDILLKELNQEPDILMDPDRYERMKELLIERSISTDSNLREDENDAALLYLLLLKFAKNEAESPIPLTGVRLVGSQAPEITKKNPDSDKDKL